jgi:hypothetical protein
MPVSTIYLFEMINIKHNGSVKEKLTSALTKNVKTMTGVIITAN